MIGTSTKPVRSISVTDASMKLAFSHSEQSVEPLRLRVKTIGQAEVFGVVLWMRMRARQESEPHRSAVPFVLLSDRTRYERRYAPKPSRMGTRPNRHHRHHARVCATPRIKVNAEAWRILRALVQARRECEHELEQRNGTNSLLYWSARRRSIIDAITIIRGTNNDA